MSGSTPSSASSGAQPPFEVRKVGEIGQPIEVFVKMGSQTYKFSYIPPEGYAVKGNDQSEQIEKIRALATGILNGLGAESSSILQKTEKMEFKFTKEHIVTSIKKSSNGTASAGFKEDETIKKVQDAFTKFEGTGPLEELKPITPSTGAQGGSASLTPVESDKIPPGTPVHETYQSTYMSKAIEKLMRTESDRTGLLASLDFISKHCPFDYNPTIQGLTANQIAGVISEIQNPSQDDLTAFITAYIDYKVEPDFNEWTLDYPQVLFCKLTIKEAATVAKTILDKAQGPDWSIDSLNQKEMQALSLCLLKLQAKKAETTMTTPGAAGAASAPLPPQQQIQIPHINVDPLVNRDYDDGKGDQTEISNLFIELLNAGLHTIAEYTADDKKTRRDKKSK